MGPEGGPTEPEHPIADLEGRDPVADRLDLTGELGAEDLRARSPKPQEQPVDPRPGRPQAQSVWFTVVVRTLTSTSRSLTAGFSTSMTRTTSGGPYLVRTAALMG